MGGLDLAHPVVAVVALAAIAPVFWWARRDRARLFRTVAAAALLLGASGPSLATRAGRPLRVYVIDVSQSMTGSWGAARAVIDRWEAAPAAAACDSAVVTVAGAAAVEVPPGVARPMRLAPAPRLGLPTEATDLASGLALAADLLLARGGAGTAVLLSDGRATAGDADAASVALRRTGARLDTLALRGPPLADARVESVAAPDEVRAGETFSVRAVVVATAPGRARVRLRAGAAELDAADLDLAPGTECVTTFRVSALHEPVEEYEVAVGDTSFEDAFPDNDRARVRVRRAECGRVLYVGPAAERIVRRALERRPALAVRAVAGPVAPAGYDLVVLDDCPASRLSREFVDGLHAGVAAGGGLLVLGGPSAFGAGGHAGTPLETLLPVRCDPAEGLAVVVALDRSGSMGDGSAGATKLDEAKDAVRALVPALRPADRLGVLSFAGDVAPVLPLTPVADLAALPARLAEVAASGPTQILAAVSAGVATLARSGVKYRHLVLVTDGQAPENETLERFRTAAAAAAAAQVAISVLATGRELAAGDRERLERLVSGPPPGRILHASEPGTLGRALREAVQAGRDLVRTGRTDVRWVRAPSAGAPPGDPPALQGLNRTTLRERAELLVAAEEELPVAAEWRVGLGRVAVLTTALDLPWGAPWRDWPGVESLLDDWVRRLVPARRPGDRPEVTVRGDRFTAVCRADPEVPLTGTVRGPDGVERPLPLREETPGTWTGRAPCAAPGWYQVRFDPPTGPDPRHAAEFEVAYPAELRCGEVDRATLARIAELGGGRLLAPGDDPPPPGSSRAGARDLAWVCALVAAGSLFAGAWSGRRP